MDALEECHSRLVRLIGSSAEPIEVLQCAEEHRAYWRPERVRVVLLAESHVYTETSELDRRVVLPSFMGIDVPRGFVRLVYCLGYGENSLLDLPIFIPANSGTPQFWKIFYSCVNRVHANEDFAPIQVSRTPFPERIWNKLALLQHLKEAGVWLVDASLAALYIPKCPKPSPMLVEAALRMSWDAYVGQIVRNASPSCIVCIGKGVARSLGNRLFELGVPVTIVPQPNARLASTEHFEVFQKYHATVWLTLQK
ncbi:MAG: hypothetical protein WKF74_11690 [Pyrinomonadaceae bacterium]